MKLFLLTLLFTTTAFANTFLLNVTHGGKSSIGVGFFVKKGGIALTSYHVVKDAHTINANIDGKKYTVEVLGFDEVLDIAALQIHFHNKEFLTISPNQITLGTVVSTHNAVRSLFGTITKESLNSFWVDVNIAQGYSGSPVLCGTEVCGIITAYEKSNKHAIATKVAPFLEKYNKVMDGLAFTKKEIDFYVMNLTQETTTQLQIGKATKGVLITNTHNKHFKPWDVITHINNHPINNIEALQGIIEQIYSTQEAVFTVIRHNKTRTIVL